MENRSDLTHVNDSHPGKATEEGTEQRKLISDAEGYDIIERPVKSETDNHIPFEPGISRGEKDRDLDLEEEGSDLQQTSAVPVITYNIRDNHQLVIFELIGSDGQRVYPVMEQAPSGYTLLTATPRLANASPLELFHAVARSEDPLPDILIDQFGDHPRLGPRGWLRSSSEQAASGTNFCNPITFSGHIESYHFQKQLIRTQESPIEHPNRWVAYNDCLGIYGAACHYKWYRYTASVHDVDLFYALVSVCSLDHHPTFVTNYGNTRKHVGPELTFAYRDTNNSYGHAYNYDFRSVGEVRNWLFHTGSNWDWFVKIRLARPNDRFNIGLTWSRF